MLEAYGPFILQTASQVLRRYVTKSDDAWSVALIAFWEAADRYREDQGGFEAFARMVIRRRLIDYIRTEARHAGETDVPPEAFSGDAGENKPSFHRQTRLITYQETRLQEEIGEVSQRLATYGFTFEDLPKASPRSKKTKLACARASAYMLSHPALLSQMRHGRRLPLKPLQSGTKLNRKLLERHRNYIIAVVEILHGEYPELGSYLALVREQVYT